MTSLDILLLRSFVAVSRTGSISAASRQVGRTQSALSMQMQRLEGIVGQPILHRTGAGVALTAAGDRLLLHAERILDAHDDAVATLSGTALSGSISFGCPEDYLTAFFPDLLKGFSSRHGDVEIEIVCAPTIELRGMLRRRRLDAALISIPMDSETDRILRPEDFVWAADSRAPESLNREILPLALPAPNTPEHLAARTALEQAGRAYRIAFASNSLAGLLSVTRSGQAISVVTRAAVPPDLHVLEVGLPQLPRIGISLAYAAQRPTAVVRAFGEFVEAGLRQTEMP